MLWQWFTKLGISFSNLWDRGRQKNNLTKGMQSVVPVHERFLK